ncbi:MAG: T9SS type A sorting domain-containing protein, partial [Candidatus Marinimicrobia bacterium]|nr:T9SS type A sorting domain-containing protein [Candidatus Neomarinimicrobiota bacterium]
EFQNNRIYGSVDIVCNATDHTDNGSIGDNNGIFKIGYEVFDSTGASVFGPSFPFWFSNKPSNSYINNVYAYGSSTSTYRYTVSNNLSSNNSLNVGNWPLGNYLIRVVTFDHYMQSDTLEQWVEVVEPDEISPDPPHLLSILPSGNGFTLKWSPTSENDLVGYRLYFSYDGINWTNNHNEYDLTWEMTEFNAPSFSNNLAFFRMTAVDNAPFPNESDPSDIFVFRKYQNEKGLFLIDNYNQQGILQSHPFLKNMGLLSNEIEVGISSVHQSVFQLDTSFTIPVNYLPIVLTGNSANPIPDGLINQLNNSSYWIIGSKSTESLIATSTGSDFLQNYLGVEFTGSISVPTEFIGIDIPFDNYSSSNLITNIGIDSLNSIGSPLNESLTYPILTDSSGIILAVGVTDLPSLLSSIPLEILNENDRINYFNRAIEFLIDTTLSIPADKLVPTKPTLSFYPNPFNSNGVFHINAEVGLYQIKLFNILGQLVWQKNLSFTQSGNITFSLPKNIQHVLTSGPYFIQFDKNGKRIASNKILFLK